MEAIKNMPVSQAVDNNVYIITFQQLACIFEQNRYILYIVTSWWYSWCYI